MPPTKIEHAVVTLLDLFVAGWTPANTEGLTPDFSSAWYDRVKDIDQFKVTVTGGDEFPFGAGLTANGPAGLWDGVASVNVWTSAKVVSGSSAIGGALARKLAYEGRQEIDRIVRVNQNAVSGLLFMSVRSRRWLPDDRESPVVFRWLVEVGYQWIEQPA